MFGFAPLAVILLVVLVVVLATTKLPVPFVCTLKFTLASVAPAAAIVGPVPLAAPASVKKFELTLATAILVEKVVVPVPLGLIAILPLTPLLRTMLPALVPLLVFNIKLPVPLVVSVVLVFDTP